MTGGQILYASINGQELEVIRGALYKDEGKWFAFLDAPLAQLPDPFEIGGPAGRRSPQV